jgi:hypothetical protein
MAHYCADGNEASGSIKAVRFPDCLSNFSLNNLTTQTVAFL